MRESRRGRQLLCRLREVLLFSEDAGDTVFQRFQLDLYYEAAVQSIARFRFAAGG